MDISSFSGRCKAIDPDTALGSSPDRMSPWPRVAAHAYQIDTVKYGHRLWPRPRASMWPLVATWAMNINTDPGFRRTMNPDMVFGSSLG